MGIDVSGLSQGQTVEVAGFSSGASALQSCESQRDECMAVARYADSRTSASFPPAEAGGYFLAPATRAKVLPP